MFQSRKQFPSRPTFLKLVMTCDDYVSLPPVWLPSLQAYYLPIHPFFFWAAIIKNNFSKNNGLWCSSGAQDQLRNHKTNTCQHTIDPHLPAICSFCGCGLGCDSSFTLGYNNQKNSNPNPLTFIGLQSFSSRILGMSGRKMPWWFALTKFLSLRLFLWERLAVQLFFVRMLNWSQTEVLLPICDRSSVPDL